MKGHTLIATGTHLFQLILHLHNEKIDLNPWKYMY